jgi:HEAT repeat protein
VRDVLRDSDDAEQRAIAATVIGYAPDKKEVLNDLVYALQDPDEAVRSSALRSLNAIAVLARLQPQLGIHVPATWFVEMLNSVVLSDRTRATNALVTLTDQDAAALDQIRDRALDSVVEMAQWKVLRYALPPFILVGRLAGMNEQEIQKAWTSGDRQTVIGIALGARRRRSRTWARRTRLNSDPSSLRRLAIGAQDAILPHMACRLCYAIFRNQNEIKRRQGATTRAWHWRLT